MAPPQKPDWIYSRVPGIQSWFVAAEIVSLTRLCAAHLYHSAELIISHVRKPHHQKRDDCENHHCAAHRGNLRSRKSCQRAQLKLPKLRTTIGKDAVDRGHSS